MFKLHRFRKSALVVLAVLLAVPTTALAQRRGRSCGSFRSGVRIGGHRSHGGFGKIGFRVGGRRHFGRGFSSGCRSYYRPPVSYCGPRFGYRGLRSYYPKYSYCGPRYRNPVFLSGGLVYTSGYDNYWPANNVVTDITYVRSEPAVRTIVVEQEPDENVLQAQALDEFGRRYGSETQDENAPVQAPTTGIERERDVGIALGRGDKAFEDGDYDDAREEYVRAMVLASDDARVRIALGLTEYALGSYVDASAAIRRGVSISPKLAQSSFALKKVYGQPGDFSAHRRALEDYVRENPEDVHARFLLGFVHYFSGERSEAREAFDAYLADPQHDPAVEPFVEAARESAPKRIYRMQ